MYRLDHEKKFSDFLETSADSPDYLRFVIRLLDGKKVDALTIFDVPRTTVARDLEHVKQFVGNDPDRADGMSRIAYENILEMLETKGGTANPAEYLKFGFPALVYETMWDGGYDCLQNVGVILTKKPAPSAPRTHSFIEMKIYRVVRPDEESKKAALRSSLPPGGFFTSASGTDHINDQERI